MTRELTIVGASARAAAASAVRAGFFVHAADLFADRDFARLGPVQQVDDYPTGLGNVLAGPQSGGWLYTGGLENYPGLVDRWAHVRPLLGNRGDVLRRVRDPRQVANVLSRAGIPCPAITSEADSLDTGRNWLRKPLASSGGLHVERWTEATSTRPAPGPCYFQEFIEATPCSAVYVAARGRAELLGITRQLTGKIWGGSGEFQYCGSIGPLTLPAAARQQFADIGSLLAAEFDLAGLFGVDAIVNSSGVWLVEVNPRYTASVEVLERAHNLRAIELHVRACESGQLPHLAAAPSALINGKAIIFAANRLTVDAQLDELADRAAAEAWPKVADLPMPGTTIERGWPILTTLAAANDEQEVSRKLQAARERLRRLLDDGV